LPVTTTEFTVGLPRASLWSLLNDFERLGGCVPGCEEVKVLGPDDSQWKLKLAVGIVSRRIDARARVLERVEPSTMVIRIDSLDGELSGSWKLSLSEIDHHSTRVALSADITARGAFEWVVNQIIRTQLSKMTNQFAACISELAAQS